MNYSLFNKNLNKTIKKLKNKLMKIYFIEKSIPFNSLDIDKPFKGQKKLINISNELGNYKNLIVKVFNLTESKKIIEN